MKWSSILKKWESGEFPQIPNNIKEPFLWRTSAINNKKDLDFKQEFTEDIRLKSHNRQDLKTFSKHFQKNKYAVSFPNLSGDTILVVPQPRSGKKFTNIYHFMKNASQIQQKELWKLVARETRKMLKKYDNIWVSSHGLGVDYLHIRICSYPKYYEKSKLQKVP